jgi:hypothetical protein
LIFFPFSKVQCASFGDKLNLHPDVKVNGEVDLSHLIKLYLDTGVKSGIGAVAKEMVEHRIEYWNKEERRPKVDFNRRRGENFDYKSLAHAQQDCRLAIAGAYLVADEFAIEIHQPMDQNILPILHFLLNSVVELPGIDGSTEEARMLQYDEDQDTTRAKNLPTIDRATIFLPLPRLVELMIGHEYTWRKGGILLPVQLRPVGPDVVTGAARGAIAAGFWPDPKKLPAAPTCKMKTFQIKNHSNRCRNCGSPNHYYETCNLTRTRNVVCSYPLCLQRGHHIMVCPIMHGLCMDCGLRGHEVRHHRVYILPLLEEVFLQHCHRGVFTSIVFLEYIPRYHLFIEERHWKLSLYNKRRCESAKLFFRLGMEYTMLPSDPLPRDESRPHLSKKERRQSRK